MDKDIKQKRRCPWCDRIVTGHSNKIFCNTKHKDKYHNKNNPRRIYKYSHRNINFENVGQKIDPIEDTMHPFDSYSLGQE